MTWNPLKFLLLFILKFLVFNRKAKLHEILNKKVVRISIVLFGGIGDFFLMTPMIKHIKDKIKHSYIIFLTDNETIVKYLTQSSIINEALTVKINEYSITQFLKYCFTLRKWKNDIFIIPYINLNQNTLLMGLLSGSRMIIGHGNGGTYKSIWSNLLDVAIPLKEKTYEPFQYLTIAEYITQSKSKNIKLVIEISDQVKKEIYHKLNSLCIDLSHSLLVQFSASNGKFSWKNWSTSHFAKLLDSIIEEKRINIVAIGTPEETQIAQDIQKMMRHNFIDLTGKTTLQELIVCIKNTKMVLCLDSCVAHIASAFGTPCIALFGPTDMWAYKGNSYVITNPVECQPCVSFINKNPLAGNVNYCLNRRCLSEISVEEILEQLKKMWTQI